MHELVENASKMLVGLVTVEIEASGVIVPSRGEYHRRRQNWTRPLIVSTVKSCRLLEYESY